jgi:outer membrane protein W
MAIVECSFLRRKVRMARYLLIMIAALSCVPAMGQGTAYGRKDKWEFSFFAGSSHRGEDVFATPSEGVGTRNVTLRFAPGYVAGVRISENLGEHFGAELDYSLANQPVELRNLSPTLQVLNLDHRVHSVAYTVLFYGLKRDSRLRPYAAVGPGISLYETFGESEDNAVALGLSLTNRWKAAGIIGGGVKFRTTEQTGFRFDVRDHITGVPDFGLPHAATIQTAGFRPDGQLHNWQFSVGFFYSLSGR